MMGGSSGVYYGNRSLTEDEKYGDEVFFSFTPEDIEGDNMPTVDDLILNIPDGGFYRVLSSSDIEISTQRLAISGSGGGAGGEGGGVRRWELFWAQGKPSRARTSGSRYQGYPPKISSAHSPERATFTWDRTSPQNSSKDESTSAIPGRSLASVAGYRASASSCGCRTVR